MEKKNVYVYDYEHNLVYEGNLTGVASYLMVRVSSVTNAIRRGTNRIMHHYVLENKDDIKKYPRNREYHNISAWYVIDGIGFRSFKDMVEYVGNTEDVIRFLFLTNNPNYYIYKPTFKGEFSKYIKNTNLYKLEPPKKLYTSTHNKIKDNINTTNKVSLLISNTKVITLILTIILAITLTAFLIIK